MKSTDLHRRGIMTAVCALALTSLTAMPSHANDFPKGPIRFVVNFPAGGLLDVLARQVGNRIATSLKQSVVIENITGAAGHIGAAAVARAQPDGQTVLISIDSPFTSGPWLSRQIPYAADALRPVTHFGSTGLTVTVNSSSPIKTLADLVERGKREPVTFATPGIGGPGHFGALLLADITGLQINPIHYRGNAPAVMALTSGEVQAGVLGTGGMLAQIKAGKLRPLAAASRQRSSLLPEVQTLTELGYPAFTLQTSFIAMVPAKTPDAVVKILHESMAQAMRDPDLIAQLRGIDIEPSVLDGRATAAQLAQVRETYGRMVKAAGMQPE